MRIAFRTGGVAGMFTVGLGLFGAAVVMLIYRQNAPNVLEGFAFGAALLAMFMRVGGGIYTKAADVGADLVGKVEKGIPEDDPRNPPRSPTTWATTSATARAWPPTCSSRTRSRWWPRSSWARSRSATTAWSSR